MQKLVGLTYYNYKNFILMMQIDNQFNQVEVIQKTFEPRNPKENWKTARANLYSREIEIFNNFEIIRAL